MSTQLSFSALGEIPDNKMHLGSTLSELFIPLDFTLPQYCLPLLPSL